MNRYVLRRETETGARTIKTTNPGEVVSWLWESLSQRSTSSCTVIVEDVPAPKSTEREQCEGQRTVYDELPANGLWVYDAHHDSYALAPVGGLDEQS